MNLIQAAWDHNNVSDVRRLLAETATTRERGFEWFYWQRQLHLERRTLQSHLAPVLGVAYSPDGRTMAAGDAAGMIKVWDAVNGHELLSVHGHSNAVSAVAFYPDSQRVVTGSWDQSAKIWEAGSGRLLLTLRGHTNAIYSVAVSPDGKRIVTAGADQTIKIWETASEEQVALWRDQ